MHAILLLAFAFLLAAPAGATDDLAHMSLEELMDIEVSLQSRKPRPISESAAAVAVITSDDLRRSGVRSIPEALRLVPGLQVGVVDANKWNVTARGFAGLFANKLLVLIDGRSVYNGNEGRISVHLKRVGDDRLELTVSDDGAVSLPILT